MCFILSTIMLVEVIPWIDEWFQVIYSKTTKGWYAEDIDQHPQLIPLKISDASLTFEPVLEP